jgi:hypothetical protein
LKAANVASIVGTVNSPWCRSLPDFDNMPGEVTMDARIAFLSSKVPLADLISAKAMEFDADYRHITYDLGACVRAGTAAIWPGPKSATRPTAMSCPTSNERAVIRAGTCACDGTDQFCEIDLRKLRGIRFCAITTEENT